MNPIDILCCCSKDCSHRLMVFPDKHTDGRITIGMSEERSNIINTYYVQIGPMTVKAIADKLHEWYEAQR
jgi:hypothetical protein